MVLNAGIVGGRRAALMPALARVAERIMGYWHSQLNLDSAAARYSGADMIIWNEVAHEMAHVETGYPAGPVNLPMWGAFAKAHPRIGVEGLKCSLRYVYAVPSSVDQSDQGLVLVRTQAARFVAGAAASGRQREVRSATPRGTAGARGRYLGIWASKVWAARSEGRCMSRVRSMKQAR